ncbi:MAG: glycosyltransferase, partial [Gemmatimonadaceae bacterium]
MVLPAVQVLLSTYNGCRYLPELLESILAQSGVDTRLLVRDDGSTDGTPELLRQYADVGALDMSIGPNIGVTRSFLWLLGNASADCDFVAFADQDDVWLTEKLARATTALARVADGVPAMYCSALTLVDSGLRPIGTWCAAQRAPS